MTSVLQVLCSLNFSGFHFPDTEYSAHNCNDHFKVKHSTGNLDILSYILFFTSQVYLDWKYTIWYVTKSKHFWFCSTQKQSIIFRIGTRRKRENIKKKKHCLLNGSSPFHGPSVGMFSTCLLGVPIGLCFTKTCSEQHAKVKLEMVHKRKSSTIFSWIPTSKSANKIPTVKFISKQKLPFQFSDIINILVGLFRRRNV